MPTATITVLVKPRARRPGLVAVSDEGVVELKLASPPAEGKANREAVQRLAEALKVPKSSMRVAHGSKGRRKLIKVEGLTTDEALSRLRRAFA